MQAIKINTAAPAPPQSTILLLYTGGTLGMQLDERQGVLRPFDFAQILRNIPELSQLSCEITVVSMPQLIDSSNMQPAIWQEMVQIIAHFYPDYDGFVILHGTDTMAYSASALSFMLENLQKPVIFTGAQLPIGAIRTDARQNILSSLEIAQARHPKGQALVPEVCIFFNDVLIRGNRAQKEESVLFDAFKSENYPYLAKAGVHIQYTHEAIAPYPSAPFAAHLALDNRVALLKLFPGLRPEVLLALLQIPDLQGLVIETYGSGNAPTAHWFLEGVRQALARGLVILNISQCLGGQVAQGRYETSVALREMGVVGGSDLTTEAAITKLMFLLGQKLPPEVLRAALGTPLRGEMTISPDE
ncbi:MAG: asparaginase [Microscillaceae bacterium]